MRNPRLRLAVPLAAAVLALAILVGTAFALDGWAWEQIRTARADGWKNSAEARFFGAVSRYGDWPWLMALGGVGLLIATRAGSRDWRRILVTAMVASTVAGILVNSIRLTTGRTRPRESPKIEQGWYGPYHDGKLTIGNPKYNSFPSGHTATAMGFALVILLARPVPGIFALLVALGIAWSRMALGAHHLSDIVVATILAAIVAWFAWRTAQRHGDAIAGRVRARLRRP